MSSVTSVVLLTSGTDGRQTVPHLNEWMKRNVFLGQVLNSVDDYAGGNRGMCDDVWIGGINALSAHDLITTFRMLKWEFPERTILMLRHEGDDLWTTYTPTDEHEN
jgi:hypothetical protein